MRRRLLPAARSARMRSTTSRETFGGRPGAAGWRPPGPPVVVDERELDYAELLV